MRFLVSQPPGKGTRNLDFNPSQGHARGHVFFSIGGFVLFVFFVWGLRDDHRHICLWCSMGLGKVPGARNGGELKFRIHHCPLDFSTRKAVFPVHTELWWLGKSQEDDMNQQWNRPICKNILYLFWKVKHLESRLTIAGNLNLQPFQLARDMVRWILKHCNGSLWVGGVHDDLRRHPWKLTVGYQKMNGLVWKGGSGFHFWPFWVSIR